MISHEELLKLWEKDAEVNKSNLDDESLNVPKLHHKYLTMYLDIKTKRMAYKNKLETIKKYKEIYYSGQATADVYKEKPFDLKLKTRSGIEKHVNTDIEVVGLRDKIEYMDILLEGINHILEQIKWRNQHIKSAIDWAKFTSGAL